MQNFVNNEHLLNLLCFKRVLACVHSTTSMSGYFEDSIIKQRVLNAKFVLW